MKKRFLKISALLLCLGVSITSYSSLTAYAETPVVTNSYAEAQSYITSEEETVLREEFAKDGVESGTIEKLINKIKNGEMLDAENPDKISKVPKDYFMFEKSNKRVAREKTYTFEDGSYIKVESIPTINTRVSLQDSKINKGYQTDYVERSNYATLYVDEYIQAKYGTVSKVGFYCTFGLYNRSNSRIDNVYDTSGWGLGSWDYGDPKIIHSTQSGSRPALATASATQKTGIGDFGKTSGYTCKLEVYKSTYTMTLTKNN